MGLEGGKDYAKQVGGSENDNDNDNDDKDKDITLGESLLHEVPVGKGLAGTLKLLEQRGALRETKEYGRGFRYKKRNCYAGGVDDVDNVDGSKEIRIERRDEFGRIMTPKEAFRVFSHKFHGKRPGQRAEEKRRKIHQEQLRLNRLQYTDTPSLFMEKMTELQARSNTPYVVLDSGRSNS